LVIRHAEVLEHGELGTRPLRTADATAKIILGDQAGGKGYEPSFTFYGFRYIEVSGVGADIDVNDFTAIVIASDMRRTGTFESSHTLVNKLHENVIWGMLGNFVSIPTDCPQRDERLGWTGDIQVFSPTASFLFDTSAFLAGWLKDLAAETIKFGGTVPEIVPYVPMHDGTPRPNAVWGDVASITPHDLYTAFGDKRILGQQYESMCLWLKSGFKRRENGLWEPTDKQFGDWLDPKSVSELQTSFSENQAYPVVSHLPIPLTAQQTHSSSPTPTSSM
jgi:alpha-L-rhamnosidase